MNAFDLLARTDPAQLALFILILSIPGAVAGILAGALLNRAAFGVLRIIGRFFRALFWPVRAVLRLFGIKMLAKSRPARIALIGVDSIARGRPDHLSEIEWALRQPDEAESETDAPPNASSFYDFKDEEHLLRKQGRIFKWFRIPGEYIPRSLAAPFTNEISDRYLAQGRRFFRRPIELNVNPNALYEDAEGAVIVSLFRESDRRCFYALDQLRRVINRNALQLVLWLAVCLAAAMVSTWGALNADASWRWLLAAGAVVAALAAFFFQLLYANQQRQNMREFSDFLTRYLGLISNRFREASATASRVIQGDERDSKILAASAQKWQKIMMWLAFRPFFIESFVRNVNFQIRRNLGYYAVGGVFLFTAILFIVFIGLDLVGAAAMGGRWLFMLVLFAGFVGMSIWQLHRKVVFEELNQMNWLGYDNFDVGKQMDEVIGKYAEYIGLWISRFDR